MIDDNLTIYNHLTIDSRMEFSNPQGLLIGEPNTFPSHGYVILCLSHKLGTFVPEDIREMYDRAKAIMSYGVYHYPLWTIGDEEVHRLSESAFRAFIKSIPGCPKRIQSATYAKQLKWSEENGYFLNDLYIRWNATREMRNLACHKDKNHLIIPNHALSSLHFAKIFIEALFVQGPPDLRQL